MSGETGSEESGWTVDTALAHLRAVADERDRRYEQRFEAQTEAVSAALTSAKEAVDKAETAATRRFESVNEFRAQLADQAGTFMPRLEAEQRIGQLAEKIDDIKGTRSQGFAQGGQVTVMALAALASIAAVISVIIALTH